MQNLIIAIVLLVIVGLAAWYVYQAKKKGQKCIGCPSGSCPYKDAGGCHCGETSPIGQNKK